MNNIDFVNEIFGEYGILIRSDGNVYLTCNDVFFWGISDVETIPSNEIKELYDELDNAPINWSLSEIHTF